MQVSAIVNKVDEIGTNICEFLPYTSGLAELREKIILSLHDASKNIERGDEDGFYSAFYDLLKARRCCENAVKYQGVNDISQQEVNIINTQKTIFNEIASIEKEKIISGRFSKRDLLDEIGDGMRYLAECIAEYEPGFEFPAEMQKLAQDLYKSYITEEIEFIRKNEPWGFFESAWRYDSVFNPRRHSTKDNSNFGLAFEKAYKFTEELIELENKIHPQSIREFLGIVQKSIEEGDPYDREVFDSCCSYAIEGVLPYQNELDENVIEQLVYSLRSQLP